MAPDTEWPVWLMKATWIRLLKRAKGGRVKSSDADVSRFWVCLHRLLLCACASLCVSAWSTTPQCLGSVWLRCVLPHDDEKLHVVISYGCQILGRAPCHLPLTHWDSVVDRAPLLALTWWSNHNRYFHLHTDRLVCNKVPIYVPKVRRSAESYWENNDSTIESTLWIFNELAFKWLIHIRYKAGRMRDTAAHGEMDMNMNNLVLCTVTRLCCFHT